MPRVNRDLQRRLAARRDRERRRPSPERRYSFATPQTAAPDEVDETLEDDGAEATLATSEGLRTRSTRVRGRTGAPPAAARPGTHMPFSAYKAEYAYVLSDLRRVGLVIGSLLVILILLYFLLPH